MSLTRSWIGLGGNLGDPLATLAAALEALQRRPGIQVRRVSQAWRTPPWGGIEQPDFINAVAELQTALSAHALLGQLLDVERVLGRERDGERWGPRRIDLDLLVYGEAVIDDERLTVPHRHLAERAFVLVPLAELAPGLMVPALGRVDDLLAALDDREVRAVFAVSSLPLPTD